VQRGQFDTSRGSFHSSAGRLKHGYGSRLTPDASPMAFITSRTLNAGTNNCLHQTHCAIGLESYL
jgi:hypothetical protein